MKTIEVGYYTENIVAPEKLVNVASIGDIDTIYSIGKVLKGFQDKIFSFNVDAILFDIPEEHDFRYDVSYVICFLDTDGEIRDVYQYFQCKYDASTHIESEAIDLSELKKFLQSKKE